MGIVLVLLSILACGSSLGLILSSIKFAVWNSRKRKQNTIGHREKISDNAESYLDRKAKYWKKLLIVFISLLVMCAIIVGILVGVYGNELVSMGSIN